MPKPPPPPPGNDPPDTIDEAKKLAQYRSELVAQMQAVGEAQIVDVMRAAWIAAAEQIVAGVKADAVALPLATVDPIIKTKFLSQMTGTAETLRELTPLDEVLPQNVLATYRVAINEPFAEAVETVKARMPVLADTAEEVSIAIQEGRFSLVRATTQSVVDDVRRTLDRALAEGMSTREFVDWAVEAGAPDAFSRGYSQMVYRTNIQTAMSDGQFAQARRLGATGWVQRTVRDKHVRDAHQMIDDATRDAVMPFTPEALRLRAPVGYNCRCGVSFTFEKDPAVVTPKTLAKLWTAIMAESGSAQFMAGRMAA